MFASILTAHALALQVLVPPPAIQDCRLDQMTNTAIDQKALARFGSAVQEYARLHRRLERVTMPVEAMPDEEGASLAADALAEAIRAARPDARQGAVFDQDVSELIRFRIERTLWLHAYTTAETLGDIWKHQGPDRPRPVVNARLWLEPDEPTWPSILWELPALPEELEYRFVGRDLVLLDTGANLVVDVLEYALPVR